MLHRTSKRVYYNSSTYFRRYLTYIFFSILLIFLLPFIFLCIFIMFHIYKVYYLDFINLSTVRSTTCTSNLSFHFFVSFSFFFKSDTKTYVGSVSLVNQHLFSPYVRPVKKKIKICGILSYNPLHISSHSFSKHHLRDTFVKTIFRFFLFFLLFSIDQTSERK